jgi:hypothetical protein
MRRIVLSGGLATVLLAGCRPDSTVDVVVVNLVGDQVGPPLDLPAGAHCPNVSAAEGPIGTSVAIVPASAIDETLTVPFLLATSCETEAASRFEIYYTNPNTSPPTLVKTITVTGMTSDLGIGSLSLRGNRSDLLACTSNVDKHHDIYKIDIQTGAATFMFPTPQTTGLRFCDGSSWDAENDLIYVSPDVSPTTYVYNEAGMLIRSFSVPSDCPGSGLAVSGEHVYQACDGAVLVYQLDKATDAPIIKFVSGDQRTEDLECDPFTFASANKDVIWTKEAFEDKVFAFEIPHGTCNIAGVPTPPGPILGNNNCCPGPACCDIADQGDSDGDGLLDCWEKNKGIDFDGDCAIDLNLANYAGTGDPDVNRKDMYVELDYMFGLQPNAIALANLATTFDHAPVHNVSPVPDGIKVHFQVDSSDSPVTTSVGQNFNTEFFPCSIKDTTGTTKTFDAWKAERFGTATERASPAVMGAKRLVFRYGLVVQKLFEDVLIDPKKTNLMGCAEVPGDDFVIAQFGFLGGYPNENNQEGVFLHELGHLLGRRHGGSSNLDNQPNYLSVMNNSLTLAAIQSGRAADLSHVAVPWNEINIDETTGVPQGGGGKPTVWWFGGVAQPALTDNKIDFDSNGTFGIVTTDVTNDAKTTALPGGDDWSNIHLNTRDVIDYAAATHLSMLSNVEVSSTLYLNNSRDDDGDGISNLLDNCVFVPNPDQADANHNGIGDACEVQPTVRCITHKAGDVIAHFGYVNNGFAITVPVGNANALVGNAVVVAGEQPSIFQRGAHPDELTVSFDHKETVTWTVNGVSVTADNHARNCNALP